MSAETKGRTLTIRALKFDPQVPLQSHILGNTKLKKHIL